MTICSKNLGGHGPFAPLSTPTGITSFDSKFKESPWRSRASGNIS